MDKYCTNCGYQIPENVHFCPRCMSLINVTEMKEIRSSVRRKKYIKNGLVTLAAIMAILLVSSPYLIREHRMNSRMKIDLENCLGEYDAVIETIGMNPIEEEVIEDGRTVYYFGEMCIIKNSEEFIDEVVVDYTVAKDKELYSVKGVNGNDTYDDVIEKLGKFEHLGPRDGLVYIYNYDWERASTPWQTMIVYVDEGETVEAINYYFTGIFPDA